MLTLLMSHDAGHASARAGCLRNATMRRAAASAQISNLNSRVAVKRNETSSRPRCGEGERVCGM